MSKINLLLSDSVGNFFVAHNTSTVYQISITEEMIKYINESICLKNSGDLKESFTYELKNVQQVFRVSDSRLTEEEEKALYHSLYCQDTDSLIALVKVDEEKQIPLYYDPNFIGDIKQTLEIQFEKHEGTDYKVVYVVFNTDFDEETEEDNLKLMFPVKTHFDGLLDLSYHLNLMDIPLEDWK